MRRFSFFFASGLHSSMCEWSLLGQSLIPSMPLLSSPIWQNCLGASTANIQALPVTGVKMSDTITGRERPPNVGPYESHACQSGI